MGREKVNANEHFAAAAATTEDYYYVFFGKAVFPSKLLGAQCHTKNLLFFFCHD
jgi:hypothetical protein